MTTEKEIRIYAIWQTEKDVALLTAKGKIKKVTAVKDAYYEGLVKGLTMRILDKEKA